MPRCSLKHLWTAPLLALSLACAAQTTAPSATLVPDVQTLPMAPKLGHQRSFPQNVQYGVLRVDAMPNVQLNGQNIRTAPGFRLFSAENKLIFAHTVQAQPLRVAYVIEASTQWLLTAWILTDAEIAAIPPKR